MELVWMPGRRTFSPSRKVTDLTTRPDSRKCTAGSSRKGSLAWRRGYMASQPDPPGGAAEGGPCSGSSRRWRSDDVQEVHGSAEWPAPRGASARQVLRSWTPDAMLDPLPGFRDRAESARRGRLRRVPCSDWRAGPPLPGVLLSTAVLLVFCVFFTVRPLTFPPTEMTWSARTGIPSELSGFIKGISRGE
jgi:hypothetical protein